MKRFAVLRPEQGNAATAAGIEARGGQVVRLPLFAIVPVAWTPPDPAGHDALFLTSANAVRQAGPALARYAGLPVHAVGTATAAAARAAGLTVVAAGAADAAAMAAAAAAGGVRRALHLGGRDLAKEALPGVACTVTVYASEPVPLGPADLRPLAGAVALVHSPRSAARLAALVTDRGVVALAAISAAAAAAAGSGWAGVAVAPAPTDAALIDTAFVLAD